MTRERGHNTLRLRRLGIDTHQEPVAYMRSDCYICRAEGFGSHARIRVSRGERHVVATLHHVATSLLAENEAGLSDAAWRILGGSDGDEISVEHAPALESLSFVRAKTYGETLDGAAFEAIVGDITTGLYADIHLTLFLTACAGGRLSSGEVVDLTRAMIRTGERIDWARSPVADKHCIGGLPGNRTSPIVVAIIAACGLTMPKTSSRAITSPAGTADTMETLAPVELDVPAMRRVVEREGGCVVWGGNARLSPADDILIRVERALDLDSDGQLVASVLSKKIAAGSTHIVLDVPVGPTAKIRSDAAAMRLTALLLEVARALGITARVVRSDGLQPVGRGIGPALEARDILAVLRRESGAPPDLIERSVSLAGAILELTSAEPISAGALRARAVLEDGRAWRKFESICEAQGGMRTPPRAAYTQPIVSTSRGRVAGINNRLLARAAKLAGAPDAKAAGLDLHVRLGDTVEAQQPLFTLHAESPGELAYALAYVGSRPRLIEVTPS